MIGALFAGIAGLAVGVGVGWWFGRSPQEEALQPEARPAPGGPRTQGVNPEALWALERGQWVRMQAHGGVWTAAERMPPPTSLSPLDFPPLIAWAQGVAGDPVVGSALQGWSDAVVGASQVGWVTGIPAGDQLLAGWSRVAEPTEDPAADFARWLVGEVGRASRVQLSDRGIADQRGAASRRLHLAAGRLIQAIDGDLGLVVEPPGGVSPRDRERWLVDDELARRLGNRAVGGVTQPLVVLRPLLARADHVLLEGEVA